MSEVNRFLMPPERKNRIGTWIERLVLRFFRLANIIILCLFVSTRFHEWSALRYLLAAVYLAAVLFGCYLIRRIKIPPLSILLAVMALSLAVLLYVGIIPTKPSSDFSMLYKAAQAAATGDFSWARVSEGYFFDGLIKSSLFCMRR